MKSYIRNHDHASYLDTLYNHDCLTKAVDIVIGQMYEDMNNCLKIDAIAATGISGIVFASIVSYLMGIPLAIIRKNSRDNNSRRMVELPLEKFDNYVIIDELVVTGKTLSRIYKLMLKENKNAKLVKVYLYDDFKSYSTDSMQIAENNKTFFCPVFHIRKGSDY